MRTTLRTTIALMASLVALTVSAIAAGAAGPTPVPMPAEDGGAAAGACLEGTTDCVDTPGITDGDGGMAMCVEGVPDCDDMIVEPDPGSSDPGAGGGSAGDPGVMDPPCGQEVVHEADGSVTYTPCDTDEPPAPTEPALTEPAPGTTVNTYARPFDSATVADDDVTVTIDFVSGVEPCYVLDHVDVRYGKDAVTITLFEGTDESAGQVACIEIGVFKRTVLTLDEPLAGRAIVDGAA